MRDRLAVNAHRFPHETVNDETILFDSETGHVVLLTGFASVLWSHLLVGASIEELAGAVGTRFGPQAEAGTVAFLNDLRAAELIVPSSAGASDAPVAPWPETFSEPVLERFDDIANIIALDPIHEVDPAGWPRVAQAHEP